MSSEAKNEEAIFYAARGIVPPEERAAYLQNTCGDDAVLLARVEALLAVQEKEYSALESAAASLGDSLVEEPLTEEPGTVIGRYKLLEKIGEGGMATVYMAEQEQPIRRQVALKIIKLGMDTKQVIARFEAERQALAIMDHPHIAKVFDAGTTETGRPYFVMELVKGIPITKYCDNNQLSTRERLELFIQVCGAIQHAHQKGIIHRDIKPSNVLVALHDGRAVPKIIDFGIAKATQRRLTEKTLFTQFSQLIGTPEYMSPEQAEWSDLDIDTRTDIYSLGVLLYELLTSTTPFDAQELRQAGYSKMQRIICEGEPTKPSTKLSGLGETLAEVAKHRQTSPDLLRKLIRGDLDWIVMKAMEKDRTRRYATALEFMADIERNLNNEPVLAAAPSLPYKLRKFVRRNRVAVLAGSLVAAALIIGGMLATIGFIQANTQRNQAETNLERSELNFQNAQKAVEAMARIAQDLSNIPEMYYVRQSILEEALQFYEGFVQERSADPQVRFNTAKTYYRIGEIYHSFGSLEKAKQAHQKVISLLTDLPNDLSWESEIAALLARGLWELGMIADEMGNYEEAYDYLQLAKTTNTSVMFKSNCDAILQRIRLKAKGETPTISPKDTIIDPNGLGLIVWRLGNLSKTKHVNRQNHFTWSSSLRVQWPKPIVLPPEAKTVVVPNCLTDTEGESDYWPIGTSRYDMKAQAVFPSSEFSIISDPMYMTQLAYRPDKRVGGRHTYAWRNFQCRFSTKKSSPNRLDDNFDRNVGTDVTLVYDNPFLLYYECLPGIGPKEFMPVGFERPFLYDPDDGNLLGEIRCKDFIATGPMDSYRYIGRQRHCRSS